MLCDPTASFETVKAALPEAMVPLPSCVVPSKKVTVPVGAKLPLLVTAAVNVML